MTPLRPALSAAARRSSVAATSADVKSRAVLPRDALAQLERPDAAVIVRLPRLGQAGPDVASSPSVARNSKHWATMPYDAEVLHPDRIERAGRLLRGDADDAARGPSAGARRLGARRRVGAALSGRVGARGIVVIAAGGDDRPEERHRQADDRAATDEVTTVDAALGVRLDQVEPLWADRATCPVESASNPCSPLCSAGGGTCWLAPPAGRTLTAACGTVNRHSRYGCTVNGTMEGMAAYEGGRVPRVVVGSAGAESVADFVAERGASAAVLHRRPVGRRQRLRRRHRRPPSPPRSPDRGRSSDTWCRPREPDAASVDAAAELVRSTPGAIVIGIGGGSALDTAKQAAVVATAAMGVEHYALGANPLPGHRPMIAIPTTAGTGAEVTRTCIVTDATGASCGRGATSCSPTSSCSTRRRR